MEFQSLDAKYLMQIISGLSQYTCATSSEIVAIMKTVFGVHPCQFKLICDLCSRALKRNRKKPEVEMFTIMYSSLECIKYVNEHEIHHHNMTKVKRRAYDTSSTIANVLKKRFKSNPPKNQLDEPAACSVDSTDGVPATNCVEQKSDQKTSVITLFTRKGGCNSESEDYESEVSFPSLHGSSTDDKNGDGSCTEDDDDLMFKSNNKDSVVEGSELGNEISLSANDCKNLWLKSLQSHQRAIAYKTQEIDEIVKSVFDNPNFKVDCQKSLVAVAGCSGHQRTLDFSVRRNRSLKYRKVLVGNKDTAYNKRLKRRLICEVESSESTDDTSDTDDEEAAVQMAMLNRYEVMRPRVCMIIALTEIFKIFQLECSRDLFFERLAEIIDSSHVVAARNIFASFFRSNVCLTLPSFILVATTDLSQQKLRFLNTLYTCYVQLNSIDLVEDSK